MIVYYIFIFDKRLKKRHIRSFQELYFYESAIKKREQEKIWNANYIAKRKQDSVIREKRIRFTDSLRLVRTQKYQPKNAPKKVVTQK